MSHPRPNPRANPPQTQTGSTKAERTANPDIINGPKSASPIWGATFATKTSVREKLAAAIKPQPTARKAPFFLSPTLQLNNPTPKEQRAEPIQNFAATCPGNKHALPTAVSTTLLPRTGVATETSPPAKARNVPTWPKKNKREHKGGINHIQAGKLSRGTFAQKSKGRKQRLMARLDPTKTRRGACPNSNARLRKRVPAA